MKERGIYSKPAPQNTQKPPNPRIRVRRLCCLTRATVFLISSAHWLVWDSVREMVENLSLLKRRPDTDHLYFVELTKQKDNITGSFSKVLQTPTKGRVLRATWTLKNLSVLGFGSTFSLSSWLLHACPFGAGHLPVDFLFQQKSVKI